MRYGIEALPAEITAAVRSTRRAPQYGHPVHGEVATGYGPCRSCLRRFRVGEERRLLFTYDPFAGDVAYPSPGPVFIHEDECERFDGDGFPPELRALPIMLEAYGAHRRCLAMERCAPEQIDELLERLAAMPGVEYVHLRNAEAGCYIARVARREAREAVA